MRKKIKVAIAGVGNCASALIQGIEYYNSNGNDSSMNPDLKIKESDGQSSMKDTANSSSTDNHIGLTSYNIGGYEPGDIEFVAAFDVADTKVGLDLSDAIFASPNNAIKIIDVPNFDVKVQKGDVLDGAGKHFSEKVTISDNQTVDIAQVL
ncbi:MAG: hypothetical protein M3M87_05780, partial [Thermoproteota archaeon]|nr:hypothetical protein [Thermoproteota archaeon]